MGCYPLLCVSLHFRALDGAKTKVILHAARALPHHQARPVSPSQGSQIEPVSSPSTPGPALALCLLTARPPALPSTSSPPSFQVPLILCSSPHHIESTNTMPATVGDPGGVDLLPRSCTSPCATRRVTCSRHLVQREPFTAHRLPHMGPNAHGMSAYCALGSALAKNFRMESAMSPEHHGG